MDYLFAPIIINNLVPQDYTTSECKIEFLIPELNNSLTISQVEIRVIDYNNNNRVNISNGESKNQNIFTFIKSADGKKGSITLSANIGSWKFDRVYKLQIRFISETQDYSEWSNLIILKCIHSIQTSVMNSIIDENFPMFQGSSYFSIDDDQKIIDNEEFIQTFKFDLLQSGKNIESSGWIIKNSMDRYDNYTFEHLFLNQESYEVQYSVKTNNGAIFSTTASYIVNLEELEEITDLVLQTESNSIFCQENDCIKVYLSSIQAPLNGNYYLFRTSEKSNFQVWEKIYTYHFNNANFSKMNIYKDYCIEDGVLYQYAIQRDSTASGGKTNILYEEKEKKRKVNFNYSYLIGDNLQLKLKYNNTISSVKRTIHTSKIETIGSKYPTILKNGYISYLEFPITGLISLQMDENNTFFKKKSDGNLYYQNEIIIQKNELESFNSNLSYNNIAIEKKFRDKVEAFLNNGKNKLFKSATEGNIIVHLLNVTLTPNQTLGRMIYNFSATACQVEDYNFKNLIDSEIISDGNLQTEETNKEEKNLTRFGQSIVTNSEIEVVNLIEQEVPSPYVLNRIKKITFSEVPGQELNKSTYTIIINGTPVQVMKNKEYSLGEEIDLTTIRIDQSNLPILIDYIYTVQKNEAQIMNIQENAPIVETIHSFGQLSQTVFSEKDNIMELIKLQIIGEFSKQSPVLSNNNSMNFTTENGALQVIISDISNIRIQSNDFTSLILKQKNVSEKIPVLIGPTQEYNVPKMKYLIEEINFLSPAKALIDYQYTVILKSRG